MANYFDYTAGRLGDHAVTMCQKTPEGITMAQRVDFDIANKIGAAGGYQCEQIQPGFYAGAHMVVVVPICIKEAGIWNLRYTTPSTGNQAWNFGLDSSTAHAYQSTVLPPATSECEEPYTSTPTPTPQSHTAVAQSYGQPTTLPSVGANGLDLLMAFLVAFAIPLTMITLRRWHLWKTRRATK